MNKRYFSASSQHAFFRIALDDECQQVAPLFLPLNRHGYLTFFGARRMRITEHDTLSTLERFCNAMTLASMVDQLLELFISWL